MHTATSNGRDDYTIGDIPYSLDLNRIPAEVAHIVQEGKRERKRQAYWIAQAKEHPDNLSASLTKHGVAMVSAIVLTPVWLLAWLFVLASFLTIGPWTFLLVPSLWVPTWCIVFAVTVVAYAFSQKNHGRENPVREAVDDAWSDIWRWQGIALIFPLYVFPKAFTGLLAAFLTPDEPAPDDEDLRAIKVMSDSRVQVALAIDADAVVLNQLAAVLRREQAMRHLRGDSALTTDIDALTVLLENMRGKCLGQIKFLDVMRTEAPLGEFKADLTGLVTANAENVVRAKERLADDALRRDAVIALAQEVAGLGKWQ